MKKMILSVAALLLAQISYFITFSAFYEAWFPYYYEDYLTFFYLAGALVLLVIPVIWALLLRHGTGAEGTRRSLPSFCSLALRSSGVILFACMLTFMFMEWKGSFYFGGSGATTYFIESGE